MPDDWGYEARPPERRRWWLPFVRREAPTEESAALSNQMQEQISDFWASLTGSTRFTPRLFDNVWVANRCVQLNAQQIARMPLVFQGTWDPPPAWVSNPDPVWYPNGIGDAVFSSVVSIYKWGDAFLHVNSRYASGFPSGWTVLDASRMTVTLEDGRRAYRYSEKQLNANDVVQVTRDPTGGLRGTSALAAYSAAAWGSIATNDLGNALTGAAGGVPWAVLKSNRPLAQGQAQTIQEEWVAARLRAASSGVPAVLPPELDLEQLAFSPKDMMLLDSQQYNARVIASAFGTPLFLLNLALDGTLVYQNPEMLGEYWWRTELRTMCANIAGALSAQMLPKGNQVSFNPAELLASIEEPVLEAPALPTAAASPSQGNVQPLRPMEVIS